MPNAHFYRWRRESIFGTGPRVPMCRERRAVWKARLVMFRRAGKITPLHEDIGIAMLRRLGTDGRLDPSHATVADDVGCAARTVQRALVALRACGLLLWTRRLVREAWRAVQVSNGYALAIGEPPPIQPKGCGGQVVRATLKQELSSVPTATPAEVAAARDALAERRRVVEERLLKGRIG